MRHPALDQLEEFDAGGPPPAPYQTLPRRAAAGQSPIIASPYRWKDPASIPPRQWIYDRHFIRRFVSATVAPGGVGKSSLVIAEALAMATGRALLGAPAAPTRVWLFNLEDPLEELERRIAAAAQHFGLEPRDVEDRLFVDSGRDTPLVIADRQRDRTVILVPIVEAIEAQLRANRIDVLIVDPFVSSHTVPENDNGSIDLVVKTWAGIAERSNCSIELIHHVRKAAGGQQGYTVEDARGGSSLIGAVRSARVLNVMNSEEAAIAGIEPDKRRLHFRVDDGKSNMAPPMERAVWRRLQSVDLGNGTEDRPSDHVGVVTPWSMPDPLEVVKPEHIERIVDMVRQNPDYRADMRAATWIGRAVAAVLGLDADIKTDVERIKRALSMWFKAGSLAKETRRDEHRKEREFVIVGPKWGQ